jgi:hypothetical protein
VSNPELDAELCARLVSLRPVLQEELKTGFTYADVVAALDQFMEWVRYLNTRRSTGARLNLQSEADVQDAIYLMLRPWVEDLISENPTDKVGNRYSIKDFLSKSLRSVVEVKYIRDESHGKNISKELHDDIEVYRRHPYCDHLIFFVYDPNSLIPDVAALKRAIVTDRVYGGVPLYCHLIVLP